ncbi:MAG: OmpA/MotB family protein [Lacipirellulaceae bacterium]
MVDDEDTTPPGAPEWAVTFGDMMSLLLTFFIMLVSMSDVRQDERYQAMLESMREQFGHDLSLASLVPRSSPSADSAVQSLASLGRAKRADLLEGGSRVDSLVGDAAQLGTLRPGRAPTVGAMVYFAEDSATLDDEALRAVREVATQVAGKPQTIEVRGHATIRPTSGGDHWELAYRRARTVLDALVAQGIDPDRARIGSAGRNDPLDDRPDANTRRRNARVEVLLWDSYPGE